MSTPTDELGRDLDDVLAALVRGESNRFSAFLGEVCPPFSYVETKTTIRTLHIALDAHGRAVFKNLARLIARRVIDYAIPRDRIAKAKAKDKESGGTDAVEELSQEAHALFVKDPTSGEGGELLLSTLAEFMLGYPQLFTKMALKTSGQVHAHGSDAIHGTVGSNGHLALCWGESKLHSGRYTATDECIESVAPFLIDDGGTGDRKDRDMVLLRDGLSLTDSKVVDALRRYLDPRDPAHLKLEHRAICLIGYDVDSYATGPDLTQEVLCAALEPIVKTVSERIKKRVEAEHLSAFHIDVFQVPMPGVQAFRDAFREELRL